MNREPLAIADIIRLLLLELSAFGVVINDKQIDATVALVAAIAGGLAYLGVTAWLRARLTPTVAPQLPSGTLVTTTTPAGAVTGTTRV